MSYRETVEKYQSLVYGIALSRVANRFDADDVFQDVFLTFFQKKKTFKSDDHQKAWLIKVTLNCCKRVTHSSWNRKTTALEDSKDSHELTYGFTSREENEIFIALRQLPEKYRLVMQLFYFEEFSTEEIAKYLSVSAANVRMRLSRGREKMRDLLKEDYFYHEDRKNTTLDEKRHEARRVG
jgi:RNA polymerase sigma-70 factor (ECF subfamily)